MYWFLVKESRVGALSVTDSDCIRVRMRQGYMIKYTPSRRDIQSNIPLCLKEFPRAKPKGTPEGKGLYLTVYHKSSSNTDSILF